ncbi:MAG: hypothetical protein ACYCV7_13175 [Acidimicrobiales bacterium]
MAYVPVGSNLEELHHQSEHSTVPSLNDEVDLVVTALGPQVDRVLSRLAMQDELRNIRRGLYWWGK